MGLIDFFLPERLPRQIIYVGDLQAKIFTLDHREAGRSARIINIALCEIAADQLPDIQSQLQPVDTGIIFNSNLFIYNFFEFDKLPWQQNLLRELVDWKLQKVFPENIEAYDHRFFRLDKKRVFSILVKKSLLEQVESLFAKSRIPLIYIGNSTVEVLNQLSRTKNPPDFFAEIDTSTCTLVFQRDCCPLYIRKFKGESRANTIAEISKTVHFVNNNYSFEPRSYWLIDHQDEAAAADYMQAELAKENLSRLNAADGRAFYIPGKP